MSANLFEVHRYRLNKDTGRMDISMGGYWVTHKQHARLLAVLKQQAQPKKKRGRFSDFGTLRP